MVPINEIKSKAMPLPLPNIDTDQIIPKQFLKRIERTGYEDFLFYDWRYNLDVADSVTPNKDFVLNKPEYQGAQILIAEKNFGCGSSREHAAWALNQFGFLAVIAPTFADIFFSNAGKNGIILVRLSDDDVKTLMDRSTRNPDHIITINLEHQTVTDDEGFKASFDIDPFRKFCLLNGYDDIGLTLRHTAELDAFESKHDVAFWSAPKVSAA
jgi:3-isopropylmalate/(R)-2-methylmalate dehydratase small subunit